MSLVSIGNYVVNRVYNDCYCTPNIGCSLVINLDSPRRRKVYLFNITIYQQLIFFV